MKLSNDLGKDSILQLVLKLAIPSMLAQLINLLYSIVDRMYIGKIPEIGAIALSGVGVCGPIVTLLSSFGTLIGLGGSILFAISMGEKDKNKARDILANSFFSLCILSLSLTILFLVFKDKLIMTFGASLVSFPYANTYLTIYTLGSFFALMAIGLNYFITSQGFPIFGMLTVIIGAITNIVLDTVFVLWFKWGVAGAGWATVIAQILSFTFAFSFLRSKKIPVSLEFSNFSLDIITKIMRYGFSPFFILATDSFILIILNMVLQKYGGEHMGDLLVGSATIIQSYLLLITGPLIGLTGGTQPILSFNYGAKKLKRVKTAEKYILIFALLLTTTMFFVTHIISTPFIKFFTNKEELIFISKWGIRMSVLAIIPLSFQYCFVDCFTAIGRIKTAFALSIFRKSIYVISCFIFPTILSAKFAFLAQPTADLIGAITSIIVFRKVFIKHLKNRYVNLI